jgi:hypothetical protein
MRTRLAVLIAALSLLGALPASAQSPTAHAACTPATINGAHKCIAASQFCQRNARAMRDYRRYGYKCTKRDANGRYHLVRA